MYGGGQRVALDLVSGLRRRHQRRTMLVRLGRPHTTAFPYVEGECVDLETYDGRYNRPGTLARTSWALARVLRSRHVAVVHSHGWDADVIAGLAARAIRTEHIAHQHIIAEWAPSARPIHCARRQVTRLAMGGGRTRWIAVSNAVKASLGSLAWLPNDRIRVVWNGVDIGQYVPPVNPVVNSRPVIGVAARLAPMKGLSCLIEAVGQLKRDGVACELRIAGDGPLRADLQGKALDCDLAERVVFLGQQSDLRPFYRSLDLYALPSVALEGLPLSVLEAMASGLPVVSTTVSGIPEVVLPGVTGSLVTPNDPRALADALKPLLQSRVLRLTLGAQGRRRVEQSFSLEQMLDDVNVMYDSSSSRPEARVA
jgi:glycosyltransferase involved in cell wall biosynthesis